jgi:hypothetical protein
MVRKWADPVMTFVAVTREELLKKVHIEKSGLIVRQESM